MAALDQAGEPVQAAANCYDNNQGRSPDGPNDQEDDRDCRVAPCVSMTGLRMRRGFSRIGIALAVLFVSLLCGWGLADGFERWNDAGRKQRQARCILQADQKAKAAQKSKSELFKGNPFVEDDDLAAKDFGCDGPLYKDDQGSVRHSHGWSVAGAL
jgi:hypothetical protein